MDKNMKTHYDQEEDIIGISFQTGKSWVTIEAGDINFDVTKEGKITGLEIFNATKVLGKENMPLILKSAEILTKEKLIHKKI